jgi:hypothetical protein
VAVVREAITNFIAPKINLRSTFLTDNSGKFLLQRFFYQKFLHPTSASISSRINDNLAILAAIHLSDTNRAGKGKF